MSERTRIDTTEAPRRARRTGWIAAAATAGLLLATPVLAHGGAWGGGWGARGGDALGTTPPHPMTGMRPGGGMPFGVGQRVGAAGPLGMVSGMLQRLPLGTEVNVALYAGDPAEGAAATASLSATVGETSEAAFAQELAAAAEEAAFAVVELGPRVRRVELGDAGVRAPQAMLGRMAGQLEFGDTVEVALYAAADAATPSTTLSFTYGEDSEAAFRAQLAEAADGAAAAEVTLPAQSRTVDLAARPFAGARDGYGPGMRMPGRGR